MTDKGYHPRRARTTAWVILVTLALVVAGALTLTALRWNTTTVRVDGLSATVSHCGPCPRIWHVRTQDLGKYGKIWCAYAGPWRLVLWTH